MKNIVYYLKKFFNYHSFIYACLFLFITNVTLNFISIYLQAVTPLIIVDYLLLIICIIISLKYKKIGVMLFLTLYLLLFSIDNVLWIRQYFPFMRMGDALFLTTLILQGPFIYKLAVFCIFLVFAIQSFLIVKLLNSKNNFTLKGILVFSVIICYVLSLFNDDYNKRTQEFTRYQSKGLVRSNLYYLYGLKDDYLNSLSYLTPRLLPSQFTGLSSNLIHDIDMNHQIPKRIMFIVNESWGKPINPAVEHEILKDIIQNQNVSNVTLGELDFVGATVDAELRELCRLKVSNFNLKGVKNGFNNCFPNKLAKMGYHNYAIHGANSTMYDRLIWYKETGFSQMTFFENLSRPSFCHSFAGACDVDLLLLIDNTFKNEQGKLFYYWMTLNTHYPYDKRDLTVDRFQCRRFNIVEDSEECRNLKLQTQFFFNLNGLLNLGNFKGVKVYIVGDHEPPVIKKENDLPVFKKNKVSYITFTIN